MITASSTCCRSLQVVLVEHCVEADDLKQGVAAGRRFGILESAFPGLERAYKRRTVGRLAGKRQWSVAAAVAGEDAELQARLLFWTMKPVYLNKYRKAPSRSGLAYMCTGLRGYS